MCAQVYVKSCVCSYMYGTLTITISTSVTVMALSLYFSLLYSCQAAFVPCITHQVVVSKVCVCYNFVVAPEYSVIRHYTKSIISCNFHLCVCV